jgi:hypothetical protein
VTDQTAIQPAPAENVSRGATFALLAIPAAIIVFAVIAGVFQIISGIVAIVVPYIAAWLYKKGAGAPLSRAGWAPFIGVSVVAIVVGTFTGIAAATYAVFLGDGGPFSPAFLRALGAQFSNGDSLLPILIGLGLGTAGIVAVIRGPRTRVTPGAAPVASSVAPATTAVPDAATPVMPATPAIPPAPNQPSPGVILNGKPVDPGQK